MGVTPPTPFVTSIDADFALIEHRTHVRIQVLVVSLYISKKFFNLHFPGNVDQLCIVAGCSKTIGVSLQVFSSAVRVQQTLRAVVLQESRIHYTF